jgi:hypothetical protein
VRSLGAQPGDAHRYTTAVDRHIDRHTHTLDAVRPGWLTHLLGDRPADVAGATTWDDTVRHIAHWRARHELADHKPGIGDRPTEPDHAASRDALHARLGLTRVWLAASDRIHTTEIVVPCRRELHERRADLDALLATAPPDWRDTITQLQTGQLGLDDTAELLRAALDGQQARRDWILANWPHVVEYQEINRTLTTGTWGPDPRLLTDLLTESIGDRLATAIERDEPWLRVALNRVTECDAAHLDADAIDKLERLAFLRTEREVSPFAPLDHSWWFAHPDVAETSIQHLTAPAASSVEL